MYQKESERDWYKRKCKKWEQEMMDDIANSQRQTKKEKREVNRNKDHDNFNNVVSGRMGASIGYSLNSLNHLVDGDLSFHSDRHGETITAIHYGLGEERVYKKLYSCPITDEMSIYRALTNSYEMEDIITEEFNFKALQEQKLKYDRGTWYRFNDYYEPQLYFKDGGAVTVGSDKLHDCVNAKIGGINCLITKQEHIVAAPEIRGLGFGSYDLGHHLLHQMRNHWRMRGKAYAHRR